MTVTTLALHTLRKSFILKETKWETNYVHFISWAGGEDTFPRYLPVKVFIFLPILSHIFHGHTKDAISSKSIISPNIREGYDQVNVNFKYKF